MRRRLLLLLVLLAGGMLAVSDRTARGDRGRDRALGANACQQCHPMPWQAWSTSSHHLTLVPARPDTVPPAVVAEETVVHPPGRTTWIARGEGADLRYVARTVGPTGAVEDFPLSYVVGRNRINMLLTTLEDGRLQVLPSMREVPTKRWFDYTALVFGAPESGPWTPPVVKPGDRSFWTGPVRAFGPHCMGCHVSGETVAAPSADGVLGARTWRALGVDCEQCHGPGAGHVAHQGGAGGEDPILSFTGLSRHASLGVCLGCHMEGEKIDREMRPGEDIFEHIDPTLLDDPERVDALGRQLELVYDGVSFLSSRCATEGEMTCVTCHDPHGSDLPTQLLAPAESPDLCASCHEEIAAHPETHAHHPAGGPGGHCVDCHMPKLVIERGHGVKTDHTISIPRLDVVSDRVAADACTWCHQGERGAPLDVPPLTHEALARARTRWWPQARPLPSWVRGIAAARLDHEGSDETIATLAGVLGSEAAPRLYRATAALLLGRFPVKARAILLERAFDADSLVRREALAALGPLAGDDVDAALTRALADPSKPVRRRAARTALVGWTRVQGNRALLDAVLPVLERDAADGPDDDLRWFRLAAAREIAGDLEGALAAYTRQAVLDRLNPFVPRRIAAIRALLAERKPPK